MSAFYGKPMTDEDAFKLLDQAIQLGSTFWDTRCAWLTIQPSTLGLYCLETNG